MSLYIASLAEMKREVGIDSSDTTDDANLTRLMEGVQGLFDMVCNRNFLVASNVTEIHDGGKPALWLRRVPVHAVHAITVDGAAIDAAEDVYGPSAGGRLVWKWNPRQWPGQIAGISVTYDGGLFSVGGAVATGALTASANAESDAAVVRQAFFMQVSFEWRNRLTLGAQSVSAGGQSISLAPAKLLPAVQMILRDHARFA